MVYSATVKSANPEAVLSASSFEVYNTINASNSASAATFSSSVISAYPYFSFQASSTKAAKSSSA